MSTRDDKSVLLEEGPLDAYEYYDDSTVGIQQQQAVPSHQPLAVANLQQPPPVYTVQPMSYPVTTEVTYEQTPPREQRSAAQDGLAIGLIVWGVITTCCCNIIVGIPAIVFAAVALADMKRNNRQAFITTSIVLNVIGLLTGIILITVVVVYWAETLKNFSNDNTYGNDYYNSKYSSSSGSSSSSFTWSDSSSNSDYSDDYKSSWW